MINPYKSKENAFTLIELLVVIAIISLLAAILFPVFATAREKARQSTCESNLKQCGIAVLQYAQDFDETFPCGEQGNSSQPYSEGWSGMTFSYFNSQGMIACPDDKTVAKYLGPTQQWVIDSYGMNSNLMGTWNGTTGVPGVNVTKLNCPAQTVLFFEVQNCNLRWIAGAEHYSAGGNASPGNSGYAYGNVPSTGNVIYAGGAIGGRSALNGGVQYEVHSGGANYLGADGHVKWLLPQLVSGGFTASSPTVAEDTSTSVTAQAAGTSSMMIGGTAATMTFSPT